jgi:Peptidase A4 family
MSYDEAFIKQFPFALIPTNIPGAYTSPAWPDDFDFNNASSATLLKHGLLLRRPKPGDHPDLVTLWKNFFSRPWYSKDRIVPHLEPQPGRTHRLKGLQQTNEGFTSSNWAGGVLRGQFVSAVGAWEIPTVSKPTEPQGAGGGWHSSSWVGIDGFTKPGFVFSNDVLQAGIEQKVDAQGNPSYVAWYEWYVDGQMPPPPYINQTNILNFMVSPGHSITCLIQYLNNQKAGQVVLTNGTTGRSFSLILAPPPGATFGGTSVEWIMEAPAFNDIVSALPNFTPVRFNPAVGCSQDGGATAQQGDTVDIVNGNKTMTSVQLAPSSVTINFLG